MCPPHLPLLLSLLLSLLLLSLLLSLLLFSFLARCLSSGLHHLDMAQNNAGMRGWAVNKQKRLGGVSEPSTNHPCNV